MDDYVPEVDTSYGLIYRLNYLWGKADGEALAGRLDQWELVLDTLFRNLLYRNDTEVEIKGEKIFIKFTDKSLITQKELKRRITNSKSKRFEALRQRNHKEHSKARLSHYQAVMNYDIWLRKFMHNELKLYMKEVESTPGRSLFGKATFGKRRR